MPEVHLQCDVLTYAMQGLSQSSSPAQITSYVKHQQKRAVDSMRGFQPATALLTFCSSMEDVYHTIGCELDEIHISAIITALANVWTAAQHKRNFQHSDPKLRSSVEAVFQQSLKQLQPMMQGMGAQVVSNILWSSAKLGLNPDEHVPGMVHTSTTRFLQLMHATNKTQLPNARDTANLLWALTTMHHAATKELVDPVCSHFATLLQHSDTRRRPNGLDVASMIWSLGTLEHAPQDVGFLDNSCMYMHRLLQSQDLRARPNSQQLANVLWAVAKLKYSLRDNRLLDDFCVYMHRLLQSKDLRAHPNAQDIANLFWALSQLRYPPPDGMVLAMLNNLVALCQTPGLQPHPQNISMCFLACAELSLNMLPAQLEILVKHVLRLHVSNVDCQNYSNVAWSLAVMGCLEVSVFDALLHRLTTKHKLLLGEHVSKGTSAWTNVQEGLQMYQALEWLKPSSGADQMDAWSSLHSKLQRITPMPHLKSRPHPEQVELCAALAAQSLQYKARLPCGVYRADAVLSTHDSNAARVILVLLRPDAYLISPSSR